MDDIADGVSSLFLQEGSVVSINHMDLDLTITYLNNETNKKSFFPLYILILSMYVSLLSLGGMVTTTNTAAYPEGYTIPHSYYHEQVQKSLLYSS